MKFAPVYGVIDGAAERARLIKVGLIEPMTGFGRLPKWNRTGRLDAAELTAAGFTMAAEMANRVRIADAEMRPAQAMTHKVLGFIKR